MGLLTLASSPFQEFVKKEVQAINSSRLSQAVKYGAPTLSETGEHEKNVQSNLRRIFELLESQAGSCNFAAMGQTDISQLEAEPAREAPTGQPGFGCGQVRHWQRDGLVGSSFGIWRHTGEPVPC